MSGQGAHWELSDAVGADNPSFLTGDEREALAEFQKELLQLADDCGFEVLFAKEPAFG